MAPNGSTTPVKIRRNSNGNGKPPLSPSSTNGGSSSSHDHGDSNGMETLRILRGCVQRIDLNLMSNRDAVRDGVMYVSSDVRPMSSKDAVFWYPSSTSKSSYQFPEFTAMTIKDAEYVVYFVKKFFSKIQ